MFGKRIKVNRLGFGNKTGETITNASLVGSFLLLAVAICARGMTEWMFDPDEYSKIMDDLNEKGSSRDKFFLENLKSEQA